MNTKRTILASLFVAAALVVIKLGPLAWLYTGGLHAPVRVPAPDYWPTAGWRITTPEEQGFDSAKLAEGLQKIEDKQISIDSLLIIRNGYIVLDAHFDPYDGTFPHDQASVTKSVITTLIGIAVDQGKIDLDAPMVSYFPNRKIANLDQRKQRITVRHMVSMVNGMESGCFDGDQPTIDTMMANPDWVQAALDRLMVAEPGTEFCYDSPGMHMLSAVLQEATGMTALAFARQNLFEPLGIHDIVWESDPQGISRGWGDLHLLPEDAAKLGYLWLQRGKWDGRQVVSEAWVLRSVSAHSKFLEPDFGYGYGWWISIGDYYASGRCGQKIRVMATINTIVVTNGGCFDYQEIEGWLVPILLNLKDTRPANPAGLAALEAALSAAAQGDPAWTAAAIPETAKSVSGVTYICENNLAGIEAVRLENSGSGQATLFIQVNGVSTVLPIGLDGKYRIAADGTGYRGKWEDAQTFKLEDFDVGLLTNRVRFEGEFLKFSLSELGLTAACRIQNP